MVAENIRTLPHGLSLEILKEGGSEAKLELPKTLGGGGGGGGFKPENFPYRGHGYMYFLEECNCTVLLCVPCTKK